jgi:hypothetical protein
MTAYFDILTNERDRFSLLGEVLYHINSGSIGEVVSVESDGTSLALPYELTIYTGDGRSITDRAIYFRLHERFPHFVWRNAIPKRVATLSLLEVQRFPDTTAASVMKVSQQVRCFW